MKTKSSASYSVEFLYRCNHRQSEQKHDPFIHIMDHPSYTISNETSPISISQHQAKQQFSGYLCVATTLFSLIRSHISMPFQSLVMFSIFIRLTRRYLVSPIKLSLYTLHTTCRYLQSVVQLVSFHSFHCIAAKVG